MGQAKTQSVSQLQARVADVAEQADKMAESRDSWIDRNRYFHESDWDYLKHNVPPGSRVLELGSGTGRLLAALRPQTGIGIDLSGNSVRIAQQKYPHLEFRVGDIQQSQAFDGLVGPFDFIIISDTIGHLDDFQSVLENVQAVSDENTRVIVACYSLLWRPVVRLASALRLMMPTPRRNWLSTRDIVGILALGDFDTIRTDTRQILPKRLFGLGPLINSSLGRLPGFRSLGIRTYAIARMCPKKPLGLTSISVIIPARNEKGNIALAIERMPKICSDVEIIFVEGHSSDDTLGEIERVIAANPDRDIKVFVQDGIGKGDAVRKGFAEARGEVLVIQDADLTAPPEALPKFFNILNSGKAEYANGSRLVYPMDGDAMRALNFMANKTFAWIFSWLLGQRMTDTLCGTKALLHSNYEKIEGNRDYFGNFDPFGDFDLIFGSAKLNLKFIDVPLRYYPREYGTTQISRFRHGWQLLKMVVFAWRKLLKD
ncbi:MAG: glycosyltransferase [Rhodospirillales bacterium]|nr:glycosyltransferase [Rhodospirillales bacterium]